MGSPERFDRDLNLKTLLANVSPTRLAGVLRGLLGDDFSLRDDDGEEVLAGPRAHPHEGGIPLQHQLDCVGTLSAPAAAPENLQAAAALLDLLMEAGARLRMAADLHLQAVHEDYEMLRSQHAALAESESRYRALAGELEARVQEQVATIEHTRRQLYQAEKLAAVGQLAAGVAHEINNPLGFILSNLATARGYLRHFARLSGIVAQSDAAALKDYWLSHGLDHALRDFADLVEESAAGAERMARIVADLKTFSSIDAAGETVADLNEHLRTVAGVARPRLPDGASLVLDLATLPPLRCHAGRLNQAFLNLLINAAQAVGPDGSIRIVSAATPDGIRIAVEDDGAGVPEGMLERVFEPFFTTRAVGAGTGLGLTVARDVVMAHGGRIRLERLPGRGTRAEIILPVEARA
jgi:signal transduction histidine kinase